MFASIAFRLTLGHLWHEEGKLNLHNDVEWMEKIRTVLQRQSDITTIHLHKEGSIDICIVL